LTEGRPLHWVTLDKRRPCVILTRAEVVSVRTQLSVAPITSTIRGLSVEVPVGPAQGLGHDSVVNVDNIQTVAASAVGTFIGLLTPVQERLLARAIRYAFDLEAD
jgi:mRNA interferase MazF